MKIAIAFATGCLALIGCERSEQPRKTSEATERPFGARPENAPRRDDRTRDDDALRGDQDLRNDRERQARPGAMPQPGATLQPQLTASPEGEKCMAVDPGAPQAEPIKKAVAVMQPAKGSKLKGKITFAETDGAGLKMVADLEGLPPGKHGFHVHAFGDCSADDASTAGPHFDFKGSFSQQQGTAKHITGNLGELEADANGKAHLESTIQDATLLGKFTIIGRSVVVHEMKNDPAQPPEGGAGGRIACGVIGIEQR
jgi:superoxide dismutase, Cu-Zn family